MNLIEIIPLKLNNNHRILITGANGMLGWEFVNYFRKYFNSEKIFAADIDELDITKKGELKRFFRFSKPTIVINAAAYTFVDRAEEEKELAYAVNVFGPSHLTELCLEEEIFLVHFSTDQVFDGSKKTPWEETDEPNPINYYATTKLEGERIVLSYKDSLVLRVQWLYGERKERFTMLKNKEVFAPFSDQFGAPTWTRDVVYATVGLLEKDSRGLYHFSYDDYGSWAEVFSWVKEQLCLDTKLLPKATAELGLPAKRPLYCVMSNKKISEKLGVRIGSWKDSLTQFLDLLRNKENI